jgi:polysaccharide pyruvyl transferase WcaK-like protein
MRIAISGYFGFGNAGDEAVLSRHPRELRRRMPNADPVVLSGDPAITEALHDVEAAPRWPLRQLLRTDPIVRPAHLRRRQSAAERHEPGLPWVLPPGARASAPGPALHHPRSGPRAAQRPAKRAMVRRAQTLPNAVTLRDEASMALARQLGVPRSD